jgi:peptidoglycan biosynthesis protein MviN/MurJ (putative lipid II flippase)
MRAYQALHDIRRLGIIGIAVMALNTAPMLALTRIFGFPGLPTAMSVSPTVLFVMMLMGLRHRLPGLDLGVVGASAWRVLVAGAVAAGSARAMTALTPGMELLALVMGGGAGLAAFGLALFWLSREDARLALEFVLPRLRHLAEGRS